MTAYLLDTNVLSEVARPEPDPKVLHFLRSMEVGYVSVLTIHELTFGLELLAEGSQKRASLSHVIEDLLSTFKEQVLPLGQAEARMAASLRAHAQKEGRTLHVIDALLAATASTHALTVVTRNKKDFAGLQVKLLNPWN